MSHKLIHKLNKAAAEDQIACKKAHAAAKKASANVRVPPPTTLTHRIVPAVRLCAYAAALCVDVSSELSHILPPLAHAFVCILGERKDIIVFAESNRETVTAMSWPDKKVVRTVKIGEDLRRVSEVRSEKYGWMLAVVANHGQVKLCLPEPQDLGPGGRQNAGQPSLLLWECPFIASHVLDLEDGRHVVVGARLANSIALFDVESPKQPLWMWHDGSFAPSGMLLCCKRRQIIAFESMQSEIIFADLKSKTIVKRIGTGMPRLPSMVFARHPWTGAVVVISEYSTTLDLLPAEYFDVDSKTHREATELPSIFCHRFACSSHVCDAAFLPNGNLLCATATSSPFQMTLSDTNLAPSTDPLERFDVARVFHSEHAAGVAVVSRRALF